MSRFPSAQHQVAEGLEGRGQKRFSESDVLPSNKRHIPYSDREDANEINLKRQSVVMPNADELESYFGSFNNHEVPPKVMAAPRDLNNPEDLRRMVKKIGKLLEETNFRKLDFRDIRYLTGPDFKEIFIHLLERVSPGYKFKKKFEEEMPKLLRAINYPSADQFNSKKISLIAPHSFYLFLHLLEFMVDSARRVMSHSSEELDKVNMFEKEPAFVSEDMPKLYRDFTLVAYRDQLTNVPIERVVTDVSEIFNILIKGKEMEDIELTKKTASIDETLKTFNEAQNDYIRLEASHNSLLSDREKYIEYVNRKKSKCEKYSTISQRINEQVDELLTESNAVVKKVNTLKESVKTKGFSLEQMDSLLEHHTQLTTQYANLQVKSKEINQALKSVDTELPVINNTLKTAFTSLQTTLKGTFDNINNTSEQSDSSFIELLNAFDVEEDRIIDHSLNINPDIWVMLKDWNSHYKAHFDNVIDFLHKLKTEIIDKREKYDELEKATQELLLKIEDRKNKSRERENSFKTECNENDRAVAVKEQRIDELRNTSNNKTKTHEQEMDSSYAVLVQLGYTGQMRDSKFKDDILALIESTKSLTFAAKHTASQQESFSIEYSNAVSNCVGKEL